MRQARVNMIQTRVCSLLTTLLRHFDLSLANRPVKSHSGARENHYRRALSQLYSVCAKIESRGRKHGDWCPVTIRLRVWGSIISCPREVRGRAPAKNRFYVYLRSERSHLEHPFQYFWAMAAPPNVAGPRKLFPRSPSRRQLSCLPFTGQFVVSTSHGWEGCGGCDPLFLLFKWDWCKSFEQEKSEIYLFMACALHSLTKIESNCVDRGVVVVVVVAAIVVIVLVVVVVVVLEF